MKFVCDACNARYHIDDKKVAGKILRIRCKKCSHVITVREPARTARPSPALTAPSPESRGVEWHYSVNGQATGPVTEDALLQLFSSGRVGDEAYVWNADFSEWKPAFDVPVFRSAIAGARDAARAAGRPATERLDAAQVDKLKLESRTMAALDAQTGGEHQVFARSDSAPHAAVADPAEERAEQERLAAQRAEQERLAAQRAEQERLAAERAEQERLAAERAEQERLAAERAEQERLAAERAEQERLAAERAKQERLAAERAEQERLAAERAEQERRAAERAEQERLAAERAEQERLAAERAEQERLAAERAEQERLAAERAEQDRLAAEAAAAADASAAEASSDAAEGAPGAPADDGEGPPSDEPPAPSMLDALAERDLGTEEAQRLLADRQPSGATADRLERIRSGLRTRRERKESAGPGRLSGPTTSALRRITAPTEAQPSDEPEAPTTEQPKRARLGAAAALKLPAPPPPRPTPSPAMDFMGDGGDDETVLLPTEVEAATPTAEAPDFVAPEPASPKVDASEPGAAEPDAAEPDAAEPDAAEPDAAEPDAAEPDAAEPDAADSDPASESDPLPPTMELPRPDALTPTSTEGEADATSAEAEATDGASRSEPASAAQPDAAVETSDTSSSAETETGTEDAGAPASAPPAAESNALDSAIDEVSESDAEAAAAAAPVEMADAALPDPSSDAETTTGASDPAEPAPDIDSASVPPVASSPVPDEAAAESPAADEVETVDLDATTQTAGTTPRAEEASAGFGALAQQVEEEAQAAAIAGVDLADLTLETGGEPAVPTSETSKSLLFQVEQARAGKRRAALGAVAILTIVAITALFLATQPEPEPLPADEPDVEQVSDEPEVDLEIEGTAASEALAARNRMVAIVRAARHIEGALIAANASATPEPSETDDVGADAGDDGDRSDRRERDDDEARDRDDDETNEAADGEQDTGPGIDSGRRLDRNGLALPTPSVTEDAPRRGGPGPEHFADGLRTFINTSITRCNQRHVAEEGALDTPRIEVTITVLPSGRVQSLELSSGVRETAFGRCLQSHRERWLFPSFDGDPVTLQKPYVVQ